MFDDLANRQIGDFIVQERIGRGAMSVVYRAVQQSVNRSVSMKVINFRANPLAQENYQPYFIQEARVIATLEHIHIVPIYNYGAVDTESSYIAMRLLRGGSVQELLQSGALNLDRALDIFTQAAQGLAHAHSRGIIHRDLKPTNILLDDLGNAYLADFGLGKLAEVSLDLTESGTVIGTPLYASPEQLSGDPIDHRSDIYSMSAILYHMLVGRAPYAFSEGGLAELIRLHATTEPPSLREINPSIPEEVDTLVLQGLRRSPDERPDSIESMADSLNMAVGRRISRASDPVVYVPSSPAARRPPSCSVVAGIVVAVLILTGIVVALLTLRPAVAPQGTVISGARGTGEDVLPSAEEAAAARAKVGSDGFIAYIACTLDGEFQAALARLMADRATEHGLAFRAYDSGLDQYRQITLIERARVEGAKAFILCALQSDVLDQTLDAARRAGLPLVFTTANTFVGGAVTLDGENREVGRAAGRLAGEIIRDERNGQAKVVLLNYPGLATADERAAGMEEALREIAPDAEIVGRYPGVTLDNGYDAIRSLLERGEAFDMILSVDDAASFGAIRALEEAEVPEGAVDIVSIGGEERAQQFIRDGHYLRGSVSVDREASSRIAVDAVVKLLAGASVPEFLSFPQGELMTRDTPE